MPRRVSELVDRRRTSSPDGNYRIYLQEELQAGCSNQPLNCGDRVRRSAVYAHRVGHLCVQPLVDEGARVGHPCVRPATSSAVVHRLPRSFEHRSATYAWTTPGAVHNARPVGHLCVDNPAVDTARVDTRSATYAWTTPGESLSWVNLRRQAPETGRPLMRTADRAARLAGPVGHLCVDNLHRWPPVQAPDGDAPGAARRRFRR